MANQSNPDIEDEIRRYVLRHERVQEAFSISRQFAESFRVRVDGLTLSDVIQVHMAADIFMDKVIQNFEVKVPYNWFHHLLKAIGYRKYRKRSIKHEFTRTYLYPFKHMPHGVPFIHDSVIKK